MTIKVDDQISTLLDQNIHCLTLPNESGICIDPHIYFQTICDLVKKSPSVALSLAMHLFTVWGFQFLMSEEQKKFYFSQVLKEKALFSSLNEPGFYFVHPKQVNEASYPIKAEKIGDKYLVNGIKPFVSLEPYVRYLPVYALIKDYDGPSFGVALFILDKNAPGVTVEKDWDTIAMQGSYSNRIKLKDVVVEPYQVIRKAGSLDQTEILGILFRFSIVAVYYGIANTALDYVVRQSKEKAVPHTNNKLGTYPGVQFSLAEMLILLETSYSQIRYFCELLRTYLQEPTEQGIKQKLKTTSFITKEYVTQSAEEIVNKAMKIEGIGSIFNSNLLSTLYRDVKAGAFHPPQRDIVYEVLAKEKLGLISFRHRWC
ncbi:acyl-CoA dehydrogenase family protein [Brevibacillus sp. SAFN-007a]|uniref:acyl-CoA dehydrogenase family protein n=1 Tax=Brevibacillus sp. SAFN-007a TaxID=3436862 RepID=UPI003F7EAC66